MAQPNDETLRATRETYKAADWPRGELRDGFPLSVLELDGWRGGELHSDQGLLQRKFTTAGDDNNSRGIVIEAMVGNSIDQAQRQLLIWLAGRQAPEPAPRAQERDLDIGDVAYLGLAGPKREAIAWIAFLRGNVAVRVRNANFRASPQLNLAAIASSLDESITKRAGGQPVAPTIGKLSAERKEVQAGERVRLDVTVTDPQGGIPHLQWVVGGPGQGYVEADRDNAWFLHTTGAGDITLVLEVTSSTGTFASKELKISVSKR